MKLTAKAKAVRRGLHLRRVAAYAEVGRMPERPFIMRPQDPFAGPFVACVKFGTSDRPRGAAACQSGKNPRTALAKALRAAARRIGKRRGAFRGL